MHLQGEDRKKWPPMKIGFLDYNFVKRAENVEKFINRNVQLPNMYRRTNTFEPQV